MRSNISNLLVGMGMGIGGAMLYQNLKNGNVQKAVKKMDAAKVKAIDGLEDMI